MRDARYPSLDFLESATHFIVPFLATIQAKQDPDRPALKSSHYIFINQRSIRNDSDCYIRNAFEQTCYSELECIPIEQRLSSENLHSLYASLRAVFRKLLNYVDPSLEPRLMMVIKTVCNLRGRIPLEAIFTFQIAV